MLATAVFAVSLPLAFLTGAAEPDFNTILENFDNVAYKTYFDNSTNLTTEGFVVGYSNVDRLAAGLGCRDANYIKPKTTAGGYVVIEIADNNAVEAGLVVHKSQTATSYLTFYTSPDNATWTEVSAEKIAKTEAICTTVAPTPNTTDYYLRRHRFADLPLGTKYLKVEVSTAAAWQPGLDYIDLFAPSKYAKALEGYNTTPIKTYFDNNTAITAEGYVAGYHNVAIAAAGLGYREGNYLKANDASGGWVAVEVADSYLLEAGLVIHKDRLGDTSLDFYTSPDKTEWTKLSSDNIALAQKANEKNASYYIRQHRVYGLPEGTKYVKVVINTTQAWQPGLDYIDIYEPDRFADVLQGYSDTPDKTYFDNNTAITAEGYVVGYHNVAVAAAGLGYREGNYVKANDASGGFVVIEANDKNVIETGLVVHKDRLLDTSLVFYTSADNVNFTRLPLESIATSQKQNEKNTNYYVRRERLFGLPEGTKYIKIEIKTTQAWQPGLDYIDVYSLDPFNTMLEGYETTPYKKYFDDNTKIDAAGYVEGFGNVKVFAAGLGTREANYLKAETAEGGYVVVKINRSDIVETGLVVHKGQLNATSLTFYSSRDNVNWTRVDDANIITREALCTTVSATPDSVNYYLRKQRVSGFPAGAKYLKVEINTAVAWQPGLDYIDLYANKNAASEEKDNFASLTEGYEVVKSLINSTETLDSKAVISYKNWRFAKAGLNWRDEYSTQRLQNVNEDAEIILSVTDDTLTEVGTVISESRLATSFNKYYASSDGETWTALGEGNVYQKEYTAADETPTGYIGLSSGYVARVERIVRLPIGTTMLKIVTSTGNAANSWWQPGIEYIDVYEPVLESKLSGYVLDRELLTESSKLDDEDIKETVNWVYTENGVAFLDKYAITRENNGRAELVLKTSKNSPIELGYNIFSEFKDKVNITYYTSADGENWTELHSDAVVSRIITSLTDTRVAEGYIVRNELLVSLADSVKLIKIVVESDSEVLAEDVQINFIKLYEEYVDPFDTVLNGYRVVETLLTPTNTIESQTVIGYTGWKFGKVGLDFFDDVGTQRYTDKVGDATLTVAVDDDMAVEVATVIAKSLEGITSNTYYVSKDGKNWTLLDASHIFSKRFTSETDSRLAKTNIGLIERIINLPEGTTELKIVTSTENKVNSWWQPSINRIALYKDPFDTAVDGMVVVDNAVTPADKLSSDRIVSVKNWNYAEKLPYLNGGSAVRKGTANAEMVLSVVDTMKLEIATVSKNALTPHTYYISKDGKKWEKLSVDNIHSRIFENEAKLGTNTATVERISALPEGTLFVKIVSSGAAEFGINYIKFYDSKVDKYDLAFVGFGRTDTLFNATRKLNDAVVISYNNWRYGKNGFTYLDEYSLQRESENCGDAELVLSVRDNQALEFGAVISNSWLKKTKTTYFVSEDAKKWTALAASSVMSRYLTPADDSRVTEGYNLLAERVVNLPEGTKYIKYVVSTGNEKNSWWQPGIDYVDIYTPFENLTLEQLSSAIGEKDVEIHFTSDEDGLKNSSVFNSRNLVSGKFGIGYTDEFIARRVGYKDAEIILSVSEDSIVEVATVIGNSLEYCAETLFYTSQDGELWTPFDAGMLLTSKVTDGVKGDCFARVQLLAEMPEGIKYLKIVGTTNKVTADWESFGFDYIKIYKSESKFKVLRPMDDPQIMVVGNFMNITLKKGQNFTLDDLTERLDAGNSFIYYYTADGAELCDGMTAVESGMKLVLKKNNKSKKEYIISVTLAEGEPDSTVTDTPEKKSNLPIIIGAAVAGVVLLAGAGVATAVIVKKRKNIVK